MANHKYDQVTDDKPYMMNINTSCLNLACCDCGLVHHIDFMPLRKKTLWGRLFPERGLYNIWFVRENRRTAALRAQDPDLKLKKGSGKWRMVRIDE